MSRFLLHLLCVYFTLFTNIISAQSPGLIIRPAGGNGVTALNPNGDAYASASTTGFTTDDIAQSELVFKVVPAIAIEPTGDLSTGPSGGFTDIVTKVDGSGFYLHKDAQNIYFRLRIGGIISGSKAYSVLIDTDARMGATGAAADPNFVAPSGNSPGNPGFEYEVVLQTNFQVAVYAIDGTATPGTPVTFPLTSHSQISVALSTDGNNPDYLYDWLVPLSAIGNPASIRTATTTVTSPNSALQGTRSDIYGVDDALYASPAAAWTMVVNAQPVINLTNFTGVSNTCTSAPILSGPVVPGSSVNISGTWTRFDNSKPSTATIRIYKNGILSGSTSCNTGGTFTVAVGTVANGDTFYAVAQSTNESQCLQSNTIIASACLVAPAAPVTSCASLKGISGSIPAGSTVSVYLVPATNASPTSNLVSNGTNITYPTSSTFAYYVSGCSGGTNNVVTGVYMITAQSGSCVSPATFVCISSGSSGTPPPLTTNTITINQPLYPQSTNLSGSGAVSGDILRLYINGQYHSTITASGSAFSFTGLQLNASDKLQIYSQTGTSCMTQSAIFNVNCYTSAPVITTNVSNNLIAGATNIGGTSSQPGAMLQVYKGVAPSGTPVGTAVTVTASGSWSVNVPALAAGDSYYATQTFMSCTSAASGNASVLSPAACPTITGTYTDLSTVVNGSMPAPFTGTIRLYLDGTVIGTQAIVSGTTWSIPVPSNTLYYNGSLTARAQSTGTTESTGCGVTNINCTSPSTPVISPANSSILPGQTVTYTVSNVSGGSWYALLDNGGASFATSAYRPGTTNFSLTSNTFNNVGTYNLRLSADLLTGCPAAAATSVVFVSATLPSKLLDFNAKLYSGKTLLNWTTTDEFNLSHFQIQFSTDGAQFENGGAVPARNTVSGKNTYQFEHLKWLGQPTFFRLKMVDLDGSYSFSPIILVKPDPEKVLQANVFPNPFTNHLAVQISSKSNGEYILRLTTISGQQVLSYTTYLSGGINVVNIKTPKDLRSGTYILSIADKNGTVISATKVEKNL